MRPHPDIPHQAPHQAGAGAAGRDRNCAGSVAVQHPAASESRHQPAHFNINGRGSGDVWTDRYVHISQPYISECVPRLLKQPHLGCVAGGGADGQIGDGMLVALKNSCVCRKRRPVGISAVVAVHIAVPVRVKIQVGGQFVADAGVGDAVGGVGDVGAAVERHRARKCGGVTLRIRSSRIAIGNKVCKDGAQGVQLVQAVNFNQPVIIRVIVNGGRRIDLVAGLGRQGVGSKSKVRYTVGRTRVLVGQTPGH